VDVQIVGVLQKTSEARKTNLMFRLKFQGRCLAEISKKRPSGIFPFLPKLGNINGAWKRLYLPAIRGS